MTNYAGPLYELSFAASDEVLPEVDEWLRDVLRNACQLDDMDTARMIESQKNDAGHTVRTCQFQARDDNALDVLIDGFFSDVDAEAAEKFGEQVTLESRALRADQATDLPPNESPVCLNCGTRLKGQYCGRCGQRSRSRLISIWQLLQEAFGDLLELDSRLWRTLVPLLRRPGQLTKDYLEGRRARYMPPFRTYLVLSVMFFVVAFFDPREDLSIFFEPEPEPTPEEIAQSEAAAKVVAANLEDHRQAALEKIDELHNSGDISDEIIAEIVDDDDEFNIRIGENADVSGFFDDCDSANVQDEDDLPEWLRKRFSHERIKIICERNKARGVKNFSEAILENIPIALIVLLPVMAMILKLLYPLSRRYFVEHLLFFVHFHAFFFLILMLQVLFARAAGLLGPKDGAVDSISTLILVMTSFYIPVYLYKAMRRVYGQGHLITILKYLMLSTAYLTGAILTMLIVLFAAVISA